MFDNMGSFDAAIYLTTALMIIAAGIIIVLPKASFADIEPEDIRKTEVYDMTDFKVRAKARRSTFNYQYQ